MSKALETLKEYWGYNAFRPMQLEIIEQVISGNDLLAMLPTGGGKSLTFQVPAMREEMETVKSIKKASTNFFIF